MRIAFVSQTFPYLPARDGFRIYGANLIRVLSVRHEVDLISILPPENETDLNWASAYCKQIRVLRPGARSPFAKVRNFVSSYWAGLPLVCRSELNSILGELRRPLGWDVLHVEGGFAGGLVDAPVSVPSVLSLHDADSLRAREMLKCKLRFQQRFVHTVEKHLGPRYERLVYPRFDRCILVAERDATYLRQSVPGARFAVVPHGIDTDYFRPVTNAREPWELVFHGHLGYVPNVQAATDFVSEVLPLIRAQLPQVTLHLVGAHPDRQVLDLANGPGIRVSANLPDLRQAVCSGSVYVCPVRHGTGLKNKVLEAMAMQLPIVAFHPGSTNGIDCTPGKDLMVAATPREFADKVVYLLRHPSAASELANAARRLTLEKYSWESRAEMLEHVYDDVITEHHKSVGSPR